MSDNLKSQKLIGRKLQGISAGKVATHYKSTLKK